MIPITRAPRQGRIKLATAVTIAAICGASPASNARVPARRAHSARTTNATDTAKLHYIRTTHSHGHALLIEEGTAHGTLPGKMHASLNIEGSFSASFTLYLHAGTITGKGTATPHGSGVYESFSGKLSVTGGSGRYSQARGHAGLYGTFNRQTYALVIQTTGTLAY